MNKTLPISVDIVIFSVSNTDTGNYRKLTEKKMSVLLTKNKELSFANKWSLPSGLVLENESIDDAALRVLHNETNLHDIYIEQLYTFGAINRYPHARIISTSYVSLIDKTKMHDQTKNDTCWFDLDFEETEEAITVKLTNGEEELFFKIQKVLRKNSTDRYTYLVSENNGLALDHPLIIASGISRIKNKIAYTDIAFNVMADEFTLGELQQVYEVILGKKLLDPAFRRIIEKKVEKTGNVRKGSGHRPAALFKFKRKKDAK